MAEIEAAGGVVWRRATDSIEVLVVHRPRYEDWSFPKGKLEPGESAPDAARREVEEETGLRCRLGDRLTSARYADRKGRSKRVRYWTMEVDGGRFEPNDEVDEVRWLSLDDVSNILSYDHDRSLVAEIVERLAARDR